MRVFDFVSFLTYVSLMWVLMDTLLTLPQIEKWFLLTLGIQMKLMQRIYQVISKFYSMHVLRS